MARRLSVTLCLALLASLTLAGEASAGPIVNFSAPTKTTLPANPNSVATGDFNSDGDPDLAVASDAAGTVSILTGGLGGSFSAPTSIAVPGGATAVAVGNFNSDQDTDLDLAVVGTGGTVSTFLGAVGSTFSTGQTMTSGNTFPVAVAVGDFNGDADPELAVANQGADTVSIYTADVAARFVPTPLGVSVGDAPNSIAIGNFDAGTDPDLAVTNQGQQAAPAADTVSILTGATGVAFSGPTNFTVGDFPVEVATADFNADGDLDLAVANTGSGTGGPLTESILTGTGAGAGFAASSTLSGGGRSVEVGDFNKDGDPDLAAGGSSAGNLAVFVGGAGAAFAAAQTFPLGGDVLSVAVADFDADGRQDVAGANYFSPPGVSTALNISDLTAPDTTITGGPAGSTNDNTPTFTFSSNETGSTFECRVGTAPFAPCTSPYTTAALADGPRTFEVRAIDAAGNVDPSPASRSFVVDTAPPDTTINSGPSGLTNDNTPTFTFSSADTGASFECRVDTAAFASCTSPYTTAALADGAHTLEVRAVDAAGNADVTPASRSFTVDTAAPDTTIDSGPAGATSDSTPTFSFSSEAGATFECRVYAGAPSGAFASCSSPHTTATLADGTYTFEVRATDSAGNVDATPAQRSFTVDTGAPTAPTLTDTDPNSPANDNAPEVKGTAEAGSTVRLYTTPACLEPAAAIGSAAAFATPGLTVSVADNSTTTFYAKAVDALGNASGCSFGSITYVEDSAPPNTTIDSGPAGPTNDNTPTFTFSANETGTSFECRVDSGAFTSCPSPFTTAALADGAHTFEVRATDAAGNVDATPASRSFSVDATPPDTTINTGPAGPTGDNTPEFTFSSSEAGSSFECRVDTGAFASCGSPFSTATLADGAHTFEVRATDAAGNVDQTPATRTFTVDTGAPDTTIDSGPSGSTADSTPTFTFSANEAGATLECRVDTAPFTSCTSPHTTAALAAGGHTFEVRATDSAGNVDATPASRSFQVSAQARPDTTPPDTRITAGPTGSTPDRTPTFEFSSTEPGSRFECKLDTLPFLPCNSPLTLPELSSGPHTFQVRAIDAAGNVDESPASAADAEAAVRRFTIVAVAPPPPVLGKKFNVEPIKGEVFVSVPPGTAQASAGAPARASITVPGIKGRNFIPLQEARQVPVGSILDTRKGTARLTSARTSKGVAQSGQFAGGVFQVLQSGKRKAKGLTELRLKGASFAGCRSSRGKKASAAASRRKIRRLTGNAKGRFRTRGRYSAATVRGTIWTVTDRCDGTLTKVSRGKVAVRDLRKRKTKVVRAGKSYFARGPR